MIKELKNTPPKKKVGWKNFFLVFPQVYLYVFSGGKNSDLESGWKFIAESKRSKNKRVD
jgi:hypothetical protein